MQKHLALISVALFSVFNAYTQDVGYRTVDVGIGYQHIENGMLLDLQVSINAEEHHSFIIRSGYITSNGLKTHLHKNEEGKGWGGGLGYRYHFSVLPKGFFLGAKVNLWNMSIHWNQLETESNSKVVLVHPGLETGYTLLVNDMLYITPHVSANFQKIISTSGEKVAYGESSFVPTAGLSVGWRF